MRCTNRFLDSQRDECLVYGSLTNSNVLRGLLLYRVSTLILVGKDSLTIVLQMFRQSV